MDDRQFLELKPVQGSTQKSESSDNTNAGTLPFPDFHARRNGGFVGGRKPRRCDPIVGESDDNQPLKHHSGGGLRTRHPSSFLLSLCLCGCVVVSLGCGYPVGCDKLAALYR